MVSGVLGVIAVTETVKKKCDTPNQVSWSAKMFSEDVINELRDRLEDVFTAVDQDTRLAVERSLRTQLGINDSMDVDPWHVLAARLYKTTLMIEEQWSLRRQHVDRARRTRA